jgi:hypothetical protein
LWDSRMHVARCPRFATCFSALTWVFDSPSVRPNRSFPNREPPTIFLSMSLHSSSALCHPHSVGHCPRRDTERLCCLSSRTDNGQLTTDFLEILCLALPVPIATTMAPPSNHRSYDHPYLARPAPPATACG